MANPIVITNATFILNSVTLSDSCKKVTVNLEADSHEVSAMSATGWKSFEPGLKGATLDVELWQDYDNAKVDHTLFAALGTSVTWETQPVSGTVTTSNPKYSGSCIVTGMTSGGGINSPEDVTFSFPITGAVTRATS